MSAPQHLRRGPWSAFCLQHCRVAAEFAGTHRTSPPNWRPGEEAERDLCLVRTRVKVHWFKKKVHWSSMPWLKYMSAMSSGLPCFKALSTERRTEILRALIQSLFRALLRTVAQDSASQVGQRSGSEEIARYTWFWLRSLCHQYKPVARSRYLS